MSTFRYQKQICWKGWNLLQSKSSGRTLGSGWRRAAVFTCCIHCYDLSFILCRLHFPDLLRASSPTPVLDLLKNVLFFSLLQKSFLMTYPYLSCLLRQLLMENACFEMILKKYSNSAFKTDKNIFGCHIHLGKTFPKYVSQLSVWGRLRLYWHFWNRIFS